MEVLGEACSNVVQWGRQTPVLGFPGGLTAVTMHDWVAKSLATIRGEGFYSFPHLTITVHELAETDPRGRESFDQAHPSRQQRGDG